jgi:hypothetical protein
VLTLPACAHTIAVEGEHALPVREARLVWVGDEQKTLGAGEFALGPKGVPHTYRVTGAEPARILATSSTGVFARFVTALGTPAPRRELPVLAGPPDVERLGRLAAKHGIELLGPPGMVPADLKAAA